MVVSVAVGTNTGSGGSAGSAREKCIQPQPANSNNAELRNPARPRNCINGYLRINAILVLVCR